MPFRTLKRPDLRGLRVTVMGLGLHGGGVATARFLAGAGAEVTVTDTKGEKDLVDSVAALVPKAEIEGEMGDAQMGLQARLMSQALRKLTGSISKSKTTVVFINQLRMKIGVFFGNPETTTGGNALKFYSTMRLDIRKVSAIKIGQDVIGFRTRVKVVKNKVAPPFRETEFDIIFGEGISKEGDVLDLAADNGIIEKSGAWYSYKGERLGQGRDNTRVFLKENPDILTQVEADVREKLGVKPKVAAATEDPQ